MKVAPLISRSTGVLPCTVPAARCGVPCRDTCSKPVLPSGSGATSPWVVATCQRDEAAQCPGAWQRTGKEGMSLEAAPGNGPQPQSCISSPTGQPREGWGLGAPG